MEELVREGKIRHYGVGHLPVERVAAYLDLGHVFSALMELSAVARGALATHLPLCRRHDVGAIAFSTTGRGLLTGRFGAGHRFAADDIRSIDPLFQRERGESGRRVVGKLAEVGRRHGRTPAQTAIAWALAQPGVICALVGPSTVDHLEENLGGSGWQLAVEDLAEIETFLRQEDAWLGPAQRASIQRILGGPLPAEPAQAFADLVYAMETAVQLGLVAEQDVVPVFLELYGLRTGLGAKDLPALEAIRMRLREVIGLEPIP
jgi:diketogulonate reductase-like aldo/keto reductase